MSFDVAIVGGGPAGLSAALALGRARKRVLLCDAGPRRNGAATHIHNFVTRDGTPPEEFRATARQQLQRYPNVQVRNVGVQSITGTSGAFHLALTTDEVIGTQRILLCTGMVDEMLPIEGFRERWGRWPMEGWLTAFAQEGLVRWDPSGDLLERAGAAA